MYLFTARGVNRRRSQDQLAARGVVDVRKLNGDAPAEAAGLVQSRPISFHLVPSSPNLVQSRPQSRPVSPEVQYSACRQAHAGKRSKGRVSGQGRQRESGQRAAHWIGLALLLALPLGDAPDLRRARAQERVERRKSRLGDRRAACFWCGATRACAGERCFLVTACTHAYLAVGPRVGARSKAGAETAARERPEAAARAGPAVRDLAQLQFIARLENGGRARGAGGRWLGDAAGWAVEPRWLGDAAGWAVEPRREGAHPGLRGCAPSLGWVPHRRARGRRRRRWRKRRLHRQPPRWRAGRRWRSSAMEQ